MKSFAVRAVAALLTIVPAAACNARDDAAVTSSDPSPSPTRSAAEQDAMHLVEEMEKRHPDLFHSVSEQRFARAADRFVARADGLTEEEFLVEAMRIVALPTLEGRDGHTGLFPTHTGVPVHSYPLRLYDFSDGLFVVDALPPYEDLVGAELTAVEGHSVAALRRALYPLTTRDNTSSLRARFPTMVTTAEVLVGSGVAASERARFRFTLDGDRVARTIDPIPMTEYSEWAGGHFLMSTLPPDRDVLYLSRLRASQWAEYLPDENLLYLQYNFVDHPTKLVDAFERHERKKNLRVVVDVRHNPGGDNTTYGSLVDALAGSRVDKPGSLFLIAGRSTFSAAGNFVGELLHETNATAVGEPSGGSPNQFGDSQVIELPNSGITAHAAVYYIEVVPGETRRAIPPAVPIRIASADYFSHRDPALEAILGL